VRESSVQFSTTGHSSLGLKETLRKNCFEILDCMQGELKKRFANIQPLLLSCDAINPKSRVFVFLNFQAIKPLADAYTPIWALDVTNYFHMQLLPKTCLDAKLKIQPQKLYCKSLQK
jgi:hypothetical protein